MRLKREKFSEKDENVKDPCFLFLVQSVHGVRAPSLTDMYKRLQLISSKSKMIMKAVLDCIQRLVESNELSEIGVRLSFNSCTRMAVENLSAPIAVGWVVVRREIGVT